MCVCDTIVGVCFLTGKEGKTKMGSKRNRRKTNTGTDGASESEYGGETQNEAGREGETGAKSSRNGVLDIGLDIPETRGCRSEGSVDL